MVPFNSASIRRASGVGTFASCGFVLAASSSLSLVKFFGVVSFLFVLFLLEFLVFPLLLSPVLSFELF